MKGKKLHASYNFSHLYPFGNDVISRKVNLQNVANNFIYLSNIYFQLKDTRFTCELMSDGC